MKENYMVCNCMQVSYNKIADALEGHTVFAADLLECFVL